MAPPPANAELVVQPTVAHWARVRTPGRLQAFLTAPTTWRIMSLFVVSRIALLVVGLLTQILIQPQSGFFNSVHLASRPVLSLWGAWDTGWYHSLAGHGYDAPPQTPGGQVNWVFFPAYPALSALLAKLIHVPLFAAMLLVSNLSFLAALFLVHRETEDAFDRPAADAVVALFCAAPGSYIFSAAYTEALFLLGLCATLVLLRRRRWLAAGAFAALASLTRNLGVGLLLPMALAAAPLAWDLVRGAAPERRAEAVRALAGMSLPVLAVAGFCAFLYGRTGDALAFVTAQKAWGRTLTNPLFEPLFYLRHPQAIENHDLISFACAWAVLGMLVALVVMRRWAMLPLAAFLALAPLAAGVMSYQRYTLVMVPLFMAGAALVAHRAWARDAVVIGFATLNGLLMVGWALALPLAT